ncbi:MAG: type I-C CRISPR-associated protein Cas8c/Csd1 [Oscillospiraceae bacterium]|jgi:CRISPR-associated protein Csd1|nr:type I-C CRISPR-associated protein Cas8c/Csd1 [Oscillospiraceae bacterium]
MILQSLAGYYDRLAEQDQKHRENLTPVLGFSNENVGGCIVLQEDGSVFGFRPFTTTVPVAQTKGKKPKEKILKFRLLLVPLPPKRTSGVAPCFLCDNADYLFGQGKKGNEKLSSARTLHHQVLDGLADAGARAVLAFFDKPHPELAALDAPPDGKLVFALKAQPTHVHDAPAVQNAWSAHCERAQTQDAHIGQCLITGEEAPIAALHPGIPGFGQDKPSIVGFNQPAFRSYGKEQGLNAPVSEKAAFRYTTALSALMRDRSHKFRLGADTVVFWAVSEKPNEEEVMAGFFSEEEPEGSGKTTLEADDQAARTIGDDLATIYKGKSPRGDTLDKTAEFCLLSLTNNKTRMVIRFFLRQSFGEILNHYAAHLEDIRLASADGNDRVISPKQILRASAVNHDFKNIPPNLESALMRAIFTGGRYPEALYNAMLNRVRAGERMDRVRVGMIKAILNRNWKGEMGLSLSKEDKNIGYLLGRVMAVMEAAQKALMPRANATVLDRYLNSAMSSPGSVYNIIIANFNKHIASLKKKDNKRGFAIKYEEWLREIMDGISSEGFPKVLTQDEQGRFIIGYYHQQQAIYQAKALPEDVDANDDDIEEDAN